MIALVAGACSPVSDEPAEVPTSSTTNLADITADTTAQETSAPSEELGKGDGRANNPSTADQPVEGPDQENGGEDQGMVQDGIPNEPRDPEVSITKPTIPDPNVADGWPNQTLDPDVEVVVPQPRD